MSPLSTLPRPSAPTAGRGRKRPGSCCLRRSSSCCASCTAGSRSATGPSTSTRCLRKSPGEFGIPITPTAGVLHNACARSAKWAAGHLTGIVLEKVLDLCGKRNRWSVLPPPWRPPHEQYARPTDARHEPLLRSGPTPARLAGGLPIALSCLGLVVQLHALAPRGGAGSQGWRCPAERLNQRRYHDCWLQNLLISASLGGYRRPTPQNQ